MKYGILSLLGLVAMALALMAMPAFASGSPPDGACFLESLTVADGVDAMDTIVISAPGVDLGAIDKTGIEASDTDGTAFMKAHGPCACCDFTTSLHRQPGTEGGGGYSALSSPFGAESPFLVTTFRQAVWTDMSPSGDG
jgi:hypothetical protein